MVSESLAELLRIAQDEQRRLESELRSNPVFTKLEAMRHLIALYRAQAEVQADLNHRPNPPASSPPPEILPGKPDLSKTVPSLEGRAGPNPPRGTRGGWT